MSGPRPFGEYRNGKLPARGAEDWMQNLTPWEMEFLTELQYMEDMLRLYRREGRNIRFRARWRSIRTHATGRMPKPRRGVRTPNHTAALAATDIAT